MSSFKNHGNRQPLPHVRGFRPGRAPVQVERETPITSTLFVDPAKGHVVIQYDRAVSNMHMTPAQVDDYIANLTKSKEVLLAEMAKLATKE